MVGGGGLKGLGGGSEGGLGGSEGVLRGSKGPGGALWGDCGVLRFCGADPAGDILEIGAQWSILKKDIPSFERYMAQLKCYYFDYK